MNRLVGKWNKVKQNDSIFFSKFAYNSQEQRAAVAVMGCQVNSEISILSLSLLQSRGYLTPEYVDMHSGCDGGEWVKLVAVQHLRDIWCEKFTPNRFQFL